MAKEGQHERANSPLLAGPFPCVDARMSIAGGRGRTGGMAGTTAYSRNLSSEYCAMQPIQIDVTKVCAADSMDRAH